jgi:polyisoprenoid-binding protein YceI
MAIAKFIFTALAASLATFATAAPITYKIDPMHTYPSFEADHMGGLSTWRGKFNKTSGTITFDKTAGTGSVDVVVDMASADFGLDKLNQDAAGPTLFDAGKFPKATYKGTLGDFVDGKPTKLSGKLTLHGVTLPLDLKIVRFKCMPHPMFKREVCGAEALGSFQRDKFGMSAGKDYGFDMGVTMHIQVEALAVK